MLRPDGAHLFVRRKFTAICLRKGFVERGSFLGAQLNHGLIFPGQLQEHAGKIVLHFSGETAHGLDGSFKQFCHSQTIDLSPAAQKDLSRGYFGRRRQNIPAIASPAVDAMNNPAAFTGRYLQL
jgi:hypothetical protein